MEQDFEKSRGRLSERSSEALVRWFIAALVASAALLGSLIIVGLLTFFFQLPAWVQIALGIALAAGATLFAWLLVSAMASSDKSNRR